MMKPKKQLFSTSSSSPSPSNSPLRTKPRFSPYIFTLLAFILFASVLYGHDSIFIFRQRYSNLDDNTHTLFSTPSELTQPPRQVSSSSSSSSSKIKREEEKKEEAFAVGKTEEGCDMFSGKWVRDELNRPLYEESECPYIQPQLTCQEHGRPDREYQRWRWQPHGCNLPTPSCRWVGLIFV